MSDREPRLNPCPDEASLQAAEADFSLPGLDVFRGIRAYVGVLAATSAVALFAPNSAQASDVSLPVAHNNVPELMNEPIDVLMKAPGLAALANPDQLTRIRGFKSKKKPLEEPVSVKMITRNQGDNNAVIKTPRHTFQVMEVCGNLIYQVYYNSTPQKLRPCPVGSYVTLTDMSPDTKLDGSDELKWQAIGTPIKTYNPIEIRVKKKPINITFDNHLQSLNAQGVLEYGYHFYYAAGEYAVPGMGVQADLQESSPIVKGPNGLHSLVEVSFVADSGNVTIEMGAEVAPKVYGDQQGHLFVSDWIGKNWQCGDALNSCSQFVEVPNPDNIVPGQAVAPGSINNYSIELDPANNSVDLDFNGDEIGYFPESIWGAGTALSDTSIEREVTFGEVASTSPDAPCAAMGDGILGIDPGASTVSNFNVIDPVNADNQPISPIMTVTDTAQRWYQVKQTGLNSFSYGGPGAGPAEGCQAR